MSLTHKFEIAGHEGYITVGLYEDGQPGELFITDVEGRQHDRRIDGHGWHAHFDRAAVRRAAREFGRRNSPISDLSRAGSPRIPISATRPASPITFSAGSACQFIKGYKEATSPNRSQPELPLKEIPEMEKKALNRPVTDLARTGEKEVIDVITSHAPNEGTAAASDGNGHSHADRVA